MVPIPVLHCLKLGPVNHIIMALREVYPGVDEKLALMHLVLSAYHGGSYEGNECSKILNNIDKLCIPEDHKPFMDALTALRDLNIMACKVMANITVNQPIITKFSR